jgi:signal transduction histidine kinase
VRIFLIFVSIFRACLLMAATPVNSPIPYAGSAKDILGLPLSESSRGLSVHLRGVVTASVEQGMVVHDDTAGIWVYWEHAEDFRPGDMLEVRGQISRGMFAPVINATAVRKVGLAPLPHALPATYMQMSSGDLDGQYVTAAGTIRAVGIQENAPRSKRLTIKMKMDGGTLIVTLPEENLSVVNSLVDADVRITGTAMCSKNDSRQIIAPTLAAGGMQDILVHKSSPHALFELPLIPIGRLMQYRSGTTYDQRVHVSGTVTYFQPGRRLILEENGAALYVNTMQTCPLVPGDRVEAVGFPAAQKSGPFLENALLKRVEAGTPSSPALVKVGDVCSGRLNYNLIRLQAHLLRQIREPARDVLLLQEGSSVVLAELEASSTVRSLPNIAAGSTLSVTGISTLEVGGSWNYGVDSAKAVRCTLLLRTPTDALVVEPPTWWSTRHVFYLAIIFGVLALAFLLHAIRSRVERWRLQAVMAERERLAHEIHDTLAQSFAGIGFQLQAIQKSIPAALPQLRQQVSLATDLVRHSHKEARRSIEPLHAEPEEAIELLAELEQTAHQMVEGGLVKVTAITTGDQQDIPARTATELLRIGQEAIANTVRHANASGLDISLHYEGETVALTIEDNGVGFVKSGDLLGFGLRGMRKRAAAISAGLEIESYPGQGTRIKVIAPLPPRLTASHAVKSLLNQLRSMLSHVYLEH